MANSFGQFLKNKRVEKNLTQKALAQALFVSESAVSKWEKDVSRPDISLLPKLSKILGVTEHELITASVDLQLKEDLSLAKKWRGLSCFWNLFFYIGYAITLLTCFVCNLAVNKTLDWFWIVLSALTLAFTFTNLPKFIKARKLILLPLSSFSALCLLLGVCCIYTSGDWFFIATLSVLLGLIIVFVPIYISKYKIFSKIKKFCDFISIGVDFIILNALLLVINSYTVRTISSGWWYFSIALPITVAVYLLLNLLLAVRFFKFNKLLKTSIILFIIDCLYLIVPFVKVSDLYAQHEINQVNIFMANFSIWNTQIPLANNIHLIIFLSLITLSAIFFAVGLIKNKKG
jgi:transcriptional regulator with XRE-family HTH domain